MGLYPRLYNPGPIEPIVEPGQNVLLQRPAQGYDLYQVAYIEPYPLSSAIAINISNGALAAGASTNVISTDGQLDQNNGELGQFRFYVEDDIYVSLFQGQGAGRFTDLNRQAFVTAYSQFHDPNDAWSEHFIYQQLRSYLKATNPAAVSIPQAIAYFYGFRFVLAGATGVERSTTPAAFTPIAHYADMQSWIDDARRDKTKQATVIPAQGWSQ